MRTVTKWAAAAFVIVLPLTLSGCGGTAATSATASSSATTNTSAPNSTGSSGSTTAPTVKVTVAYPEPVATFAPIFVAADEGFFAKDGLNASLVLVHGPQEVAAVTSGSLQFAVAGAPSVMAADLSGGSVVMLASLAPFPIYDLDAGPRIKTPSDLAGKAVGVAVIGGVGEEYLRLYLQQEHLLGKVKITALGSEPALLAALKQGIVAAAMFNPPLTTEAEQAGFPALMDSLKLGLPFANSAVEVTRSYLNSNRPVVTDFLKAFLESWKFVSDPANKATVVTVLEKYTKATSAQAAAAYDSYQPVWASIPLPTISPKGVQNVLPFLKNPGAASANPQQFFDNSILQSVAGG